MSLTDPFLILAFSIQNLFLYETHEYLLSIGLGLA